MKKIVYTLLIPTAIFAYSCGGETPTDEVETNDQIADEIEELDYSDMMLVDMREYDLPVSMMLPIIQGSDEASKPDVIHNEDVTWKVSVGGEKFDLQIEDWGTEEKTIADFKKGLEQDDIYSFTVINEDEDEIVYKRGLKSEEGEEGGYGSSHFYFIRKIGDTYYTMESNPMGQFTTARARDMLRAAKSMQE